MSQQFRNIIGGKAVEAASGETYDIVNPATGEVYAAGAGLGRGGRRPRHAGGRGGVRDLGGDHPAERQKALLKIADALEERAAEFVKAECENTGKPLGLTESEELPPCVDQLRFFAGAARVLEGRVGRRVHEGPHLHASAASRSASSAR